MASGSVPQSSGETAVVPYRTDVVDAEIIDEVPTRKELIKLGARELDATGVDPDSWVDADTEAQLRRATPENTLLALRWGWGRWIWWTGRAGRQHLPAHPNSVRQYIKDHGEMRYPPGHKRAGEKRGRYGQPYAPDTVELAVYVISMVHRRLGYHSPLEDPNVGRQLEGYRNDWEAAKFRPDVSAPLNHDLSVTLARACDLGTVNGLRNSAMMRGQFDLGCRASEWCHVQGQDLSWESEDKVVVTFTRTKTKGERKVAMQAVRGVDWDVDPVRLLLAYYRARVAAGWNGDGPLWVEVSHGPRRKDFEQTGVLGGRFRDGVEMTRESYEAVFNRAVAKTGINLDPVTRKPAKSKHFTTHSNRAGMITEAVDAGIPIEKVSKRTGHSPASPVIHGYYRSGRQWDDDNAGVVIRRRRAEKTED